MRPPPPHGAQSAPWGPRRNGATSAEGVPTVRLVHGGVQYREYLNEEQRSQTRGPNVAAALGWRRDAAPAECSWSFTTGC